MNKTSFRVLLVLMVLAGSTLACSLFTGGPKAAPTPLPTPIPVEPTIDVEQALQTAVASPSTSGEVEIKLTDSQMTQYLVQQLNNQTDPILQNPSVHAHDGVIEIDGAIKRSLISGNVKVTLVPSVDEQGVPHLKIDSANLGPIPVPDSILENFSSMISESMNSSAASSQTDFEVKSIQVFDGYLLITAVEK